LKNLVENRYDSLGVRGAFDVLSLSGAILVVVGTVPRTGAAEIFWKKFLYLILLLNRVS
jgi:hypothetical protein